MNQLALRINLTLAGYLHGDWTFDDFEHDPISPEFVVQAFADWVASLPAVLTNVINLGGGKTRVVPKYIPEVYDCDNIARSFANFIDEALAVDAAVKGQSRGNPAAGKFNFKLDSGDGHARNWFADYAGKIHSFDAGLGDFTQESASEKASIMGGETI